MFTGLIEEVGAVETAAPRGAGSRLRIRCSSVLEGSRDGDSINVNGVCLTAVDLGPGSFSADVSPETLRRSNLALLRPGALVNLERPLSPGGRLGGHIVQGHVDGTGELLSLEPLGDENWWLRLQAPSGLDRYLVHKGSLSIDGISLTIAAVAGGLVEATIIPHTYRNTNLHARRPGDRLNLECDIIAKYVEKLAARLETPSRLTVERLREEGF